MARRRAVLRLCGDFPRGSLVGMVECVDESRQPRLLNIFNTFFLLYTTCVNCVAALPLICVAVAVAVAVIVNIITVKTHSRVLSYTLLKGGILVDMICQSTLAGYVAHRLPGHSVYERRSFFFFFVISRQSVGPRGLY